MNSKFATRSTRLAKTGRAIGSFAAKALACTACLLIGSAVAKPATPYAHMAPIQAYLMDRTQEIALARSAAPRSVSNYATVLVLTRTGYEIGVKGSNGFVCMVGRGFNGAPDWPERWNPKVRAAECLNPAAARSVAPFAKLRVAMLLAGRSDAEILDRFKRALRTHEIPPLESGAMSYMMSKTAYLSDEGDHRMPHLMFFVAVKRDADWGANAPDTPVFGGNYWYVTRGHEAETAKLPPLSIFLVQVANWSDGSPSMAHRM